MPILEKIIRFAAIAIAVLFIGLSLVGIFGAWFVESQSHRRNAQGFWSYRDLLGVQVDARSRRVNDLD